MFSAHPASIASIASHSRDDAAPGARVLCVCLCWIMRLYWGVTRHPAQELEDPLLSTGLARNRDDLRRLIRLVDTDGSGEIGFDEFLAVLRPSQGGGGVGSANGEAASAFAALQATISKDGALPLQVRAGQVVVFCVHVCLSLSVIIGAAVCRVCLCARPHRPQTAPRRVPAPAAACR